MQVKKIFSELFINNFFEITFVTFITVMPEPGGPGGPPMFFTFRHHCDKMMNNQSQILVHGFKKHTPLITDYILLPVHTVLLVLIIWISFKVQTAVFKILERLGTRHINTIIKTNMVTKKFWMYLQYLFVVIYFFKVTQCKGSFCKLSCIFQRKLFTMASKPFGSFIWFFIPPCKFNWYFVDFNLKDIFKKVTQRKSLKEIQLQNIFFPSCTFFTYQM